MVIITKSSFPPSSANEIGKRFTELPALPDYITMRGPFVRGSAGEGVQVTAIYECDNSKLAEAVEHVSNRMVPYFGVTGFKYSVDTWLEAIEALKMIGLG
ncbi:MAG: hypothetical protein HN580_20185 [Deltaproteobacteria bacterium]|nr:hypothetical protein [Deltaproteobacteria bacterium]MBT4087054.1 hypothetical protein [Deltaproteobacteria bacterium]MBT4269384.1 hypothetical protein [Deltaproteobacteria bacterium]MBT4638679.1 hypothetical protein [Deltaproteobacteria bacterium]MBT6501894.1 hypothetical protein [Deltaproteobacteria bacterium]